MEGSSPNKELLGLEYTAYSNGSPNLKSPKSKVSSASSHYEDVLIPTKEALETSGEFDITLLKDYEEASEDIARMRSNTIDSFNNERDANNRRQNSSNYFDYKSPKDVGINIELPSPHNYPCYSPITPTYHPNKNTHRFMLYSAEFDKQYFTSLYSMKTTLGDKLDEIILKGNFWLDILSATADELHILSKVFHIHPLTIEDIKIEEQREKCEIFKHYYFVCYRTFKQNPQTPTPNFLDVQEFMDPLHIYSIVYDDALITFHSQSISHIENVLDRVAQLQGHIILSPDWLHYAILDDITDSIQPILKTLEYETDTIDELVLILRENEQADMLRRIGHARKKLTSLIRLLSTKPDVVKALTLKSQERRKRDRMEMKLYLADVQDHLITMVQNALHYEKVLSRAHANYLAQISIELTQVSNRTNDVVAKFTALASILLPMNVVTGLWGMNVEVPGQYSDGLAWFFGILTCMFLLSAIFFLLVKRTGVL